MGVGQCLAFRLELGEQLIPVLVGQRLPAKRTLGLARFPLQQVELFLAGVHLGPQLVVAHLQAGRFFGQRLELLPGSIALGLPLG